ncbi:MAG: 5'-3' exonuclease H3TH domain-containing protein [bacterium]|nr:5'-3' exonuclease H3TH domain-containing protein [bacterium]
MKDTLLLIDANSLIHRAFHALPPFTTPDGRPSGALYGIASILIKILKERPFEFGVAAFDHPSPTVREGFYAAYKATRPPAADTLISQIKESHKLLTIFGIKTLEHPGWEADDIVATLARRFRDKENLQIIILSGDLDMLQAVEKDYVVVETPKKGISNTVIYNEEAVRERFGVLPANLADFKGLTGDTSDNIPGVPGIGPKTASDLISRYGALENLYEELVEIGISNKKLQQKLLDYKDQALLSKKLATLKTDLPVDAANLEDLHMDSPLADPNLVRYLENLGFESLVKRITEHNGV